MAFCRYCGRELADGELCTCRESASQQTTNNTDTKASVQIGQNANINNTPNVMNESSVSIDFGTVVGFVKNYINNPKNAAKIASDNNDWISFIVCLILLMISMTISQFSIWALSNVFSGYYFVFGIVFALLSATLPFASNYAIAFVNKVKVSPKELLFKSVMRTPVWDASLILIAFSGIVGLKAFFVAVVFSLIVYSISQLSVLLEIFNNRRKNLLVMGVVAAVFILCAYFLISIELKAVGKMLTSTLLGYLWN